MNNSTHIRKLYARIRFVLALFMLGLAVSGATAIPLADELDLLTQWMGLPAGASPHAYAGLPGWLLTVRAALRDVDTRWPFLFYGTDWLAFGHFVIAIAFLGPWRDPVRNVWVITFGMIACVLVIPYALVFGPLRGIPFYWRLIDCAFGVVGFFPLLWCRLMVGQLERRGVSAY
ncbi:hypothetical protein CCAX7_16750 [Capsulimonas corticalis]|uniref:Uncharacterized protein n=1 Tax=Capsulimonas corticalis TaxID=2219043 RepID=A0A402CYY3_9BACT|nr:hypothetical protein [Capsulimonas corticalis]BDI29624.1 hypothetical protein CCAX7_16750 [Capsulimonas corticalis]